MLSHRVAPPLVFTSIEFVRVSPLFGPVTPRGSDLDCGGTQIHVQSDAHMGNGGKGAIVHRLSASLHESGIALVRELVAQRLDHSPPQAFHDRIHKQSTQLILDSDVMERPIEACHRSTAALTRSTAP